MSYPKNTAYSRITKISLAILATGSALAVASAIIPSTGAWFFEGRSGQMVTRTGNMHFNVTSSDGSIIDGPFELTYDGLSPGNPVTRSFTLHNTGSLTGWLDVSLSNLQSNATSGLDLTQLKYSVNGSVPFSLAQVRSTSMMVGEVAPGAEKTVTITLSLDDDAGTEWQDVSATNTLKLGLAQKH